MAVYTSVSQSALREFLTQYDIGSPVTFKGIAEGVENSNYFLETTTGKYILTLFERRVDPKDLPYFIGLKEHLARKGFACPQPIAGKDGATLRTLEGRSAVIISFLNGVSVTSPTEHHCAKLGKGLAQLHAAGADFPLRRANSLGPEAWPTLWQGRAASANALEPNLADLIEKDLEEVAAANIQAMAGPPFDLPYGTIHADLFPDNVFFLNDAFSGAIDFYFACSDFLAYDLAICINAWCFEPNGAFSKVNATALIEAYQSQRQLTEAERGVLPVLARGAALRFFLTRLVDWSDTPPDALVRPHDPLDYAKRLEVHRQMSTFSDYCS